MKQLMQRCLFSALVGSTLALVGCNGDSRPARAPVSGTVTQNGAPVAGAVVTFVPSSKDGSSATGVTDESGKYTLSTFSSGDGAVPGSYAVKVAKYDNNAEADAPAAAGTATGDGSTIDDTGYEPPGDEGAEDTGPPKSILGDKYANHTQSGLTYTVVEGENTYDINLE